MQIAFHPERTLERCRQLEIYIQKHVLGEDSAFVCDMYQECLNSCAQRLYFPAQLHHIGDYYDTEIGGQDLRIVIVGQEYGSPHIGVNLTQRKVGIRRSAKAGFSGRNPHMQGTTSMLRILFGNEPGTDIEGERLSNGGHLFEAFALVNGLLCSAIDRISYSGSAHGHPTPVMYKNCGIHFQRVIEILEPTIVIIQSVGALSWWIGQHVGLGSPVPTKPVQVRISGRSVLMMSFAHPSAGGKYGWWGRSPNSAYLHETVIPILRDCSPFSRSSARGDTSPAA